MRTAALLNSGMTEVKRQSWVFQVVLDDQSEIYVNKNRGINCSFDPNNKQYKWPLGSFILNNLKSNTVKKIKYIYIYIYIYTYIGIYYTYAIHFVMTSLIYMYMYNIYVCIYIYVYICIYK